MDRQTKTICTIGPASETPEILEKLVEAGMDVARLNFSHAKFEQLTHVKKHINEFNQKHNKDCKILMDLQGPRMRIGELPESGIELKEGEIITFSTNKENKDAIHINDPYLHVHIQPNHPIFIADGNFELYVTEVNGNEIKAKVVRGGILFSRKGVNVPDTDIPMGALTEKDIKDVQFGIENGVDFIALSFVKNGDDLKELRKYTEGTNIKLVAKIERKQALINLDSIIEATDFIMVARGDLGIELPLEEIPLIQKDIIKRASRQGKPCIVATQMLLSMVNHHRPTRAEVSDVANAVLDGAWAVMLSDESAFGKYPIQSLEYLIKAIRVVENFEYIKQHSSSIA